MASPHRLRNLLVSGSALVALGLMQPCPAQTSKPTKTPAAKEAGLVKKKTAKATSPVQIAVVDMERARKGHPLYKVRSKEFADWGRSQQDEIKKLDKTIQTMQTQLKTLQRGTEAYEKLAGEIQDSISKYQRLRKWFRDKTQAKHARMVLELHKQVLEAIGELAPKRGIHLVLRRQPHLVKGLLGERIKRVEATDVLYASATLDITDDVIDYLKTKYPSK